ncbi:hypothetical protein GCM10022270_17130 [Terriglobus aquaticus]
MVALKLARAGRQVTLLEKSKEAHDKVCGDFLSRESLGYLESVGLSPETLGAVPIRTVRVVTPKFQKESALPFPAWSLTRRVLDEALLTEAARQGAEVVRDAHVASLLHEDAAWIAVLRDGRRWCARNAVLATGKLDVNGWPRPEGTQPGLVAFKMYFCLSEEQQTELGDAVELAFYPGGYTGLQRVESGRANLTILVDGRHLRASGSQWTAVLQSVLDASPHLQHRLRGAVEMLPKPLTASRIPYGHVQRDGEDGLWRVGDQAAVIPSLCGDGTAIALHCGALAAACMLRGDGAPAYQRRLHRQVSTRVGLATGISRLMVGHPAASDCLRVFPGLLRTVAMLTRISDSALEETRKIAEQATKG